MDPLYFYFSHSSFTRLLFTHPQTLENKAATLSLPLIATAKILHQNHKSIDAATTIIRFLINLQRRHFISALDSQLCFIDPSFAHRKCFQKCCNKKGDITCEICNQIYSPDYALPPARINPDVMTIDISMHGARKSIPGCSLLDFASENQFLELDYEDYGVGSNNNNAYPRFMALILCWS
ncbi:putative E3 ubiquitin-protein ligase MARCH [Helianthus annuus]|nr:putative E3 ubiquitin-protein ligase MARCH [Helianthus annuus]